MPDSAPTKPMSSSGKSTHYSEAKFGGTDRLFATISRPEDFKFDERVAEVFDDMISRSVPFYEETLETSLSLARKFVQKGSNVYDLGCSTATVLLRLSEMTDDSEVRLIGIDNSSAMLDQARKKLFRKKPKTRIELRNASIEDEMDLTDASVVFMHYTLQFIPLSRRSQVLRTVYEGLRPQGCLILVEKVLGTDARLDRLYVELYHAYKSRMGYSPAEIARKREALERVLIPSRVEENVAMLERCGFAPIDVFFRWMNFAGFLAVKS